MKVLVAFTVLLAVAFIGNTEASRCDGQHMSDEQKALRKYTGPKLVSTGKADVTYRWMKVAGKVVVPYTIDAIYSAADKAVIMEGMKQISNRTCVTFVPKTSTHVDYLKVFSSDGCWSYVGRQGGMQELSLQVDGCMTPGTVTHEFVHALGFEHMQCNFYRDHYVDVFEANIDPAQFSNYDKVVNENYLNFGTAYDFKSNMHYDRYSFANPGLDAMLPKARFAEFTDTMGHFESLSVGDIKRINVMYSCLVHGRQF